MKDERGVRDEISLVQLNIVDINGRVVKAIAEKHDLEPGIYRENIEMADLAPGGYFVKIQTPGGGVGVAKVIKTE